MTKLQKIALTALGVLIVPAAAMAAAGPVYVRSWELPIGGEGGWDIITVDQASHRLYISQSTRVVVVDLKKKSIVGEIKDTPGVHDIAIAGEGGRVFVSNGKENTVSVVDPRTLKTETRIPVGTKPDVIIYEPGNNEIYAFNGGSHNATVIDAKDLTVTATVDLPGKPEFAAAEPRAHRVYVNIEDKNEYVAIDTSTHRLAGAWPLEGCDEPSPLDIDLKGRKLFISCGNEKLVMVDASDGRILSSVPIGKGVDGGAYDPNSRLAFASTGEGTVTIARAVGSQLETVQTLETAKGSRTMTIDPSTGRIFLMSARFEKAAGGEGPGHRPKIVAGSQKLLTFALTHHN